VSGIFVESHGVAKSLFSACLTCIMDLNAYHDNSIDSFVISSVCLLMMGSKCGWGLEEGSKFQLVVGLIIGHFQAEGAV